MTYGTDAEDLGSRLHVTLVPPPHVCKNVRGGKLCGVEVDAKGLRFDGGT